MGPIERGALNAPAQHAPTVYGICRHDANDAVWVKQRHACARDTYQYRVSVICVMLLIKGKDASGKSTARKRAASVSG